MSTSTPCVCCRHSTTKVLVQRIMNDQTTSVVESAIVFLFVTIWLPSRVHARGRMMEPPQRSSLYSRGFNSPRNDDDSALNCGGPWRQHELNGGKCGVCGDAYDAVVRENEAGGKFANGIIANTYTTNDSSVPVVIDIQSFLKGYFEFRICPHNNIEVPVEQSCLDRHPLRVWDFEDSHPRYQYFPKGMGLQRLRVELPRGMTCSQCVLQWKWQTGNNWGRCDDGLYRVGCGPQETYINCADVAIVPAVELEYGHFLPEIPNVHAPFPNGGNTPRVDSRADANQADSNVMPFASVSFVSHDSKTVVELRNSSDPTDAPIVSSYNPETGSVQSVPGSFLPKEAIEVVPEKPVQPKFDFYDPSTVVNEVIIPEQRSEPIVPLELGPITPLDTLESENVKKDIVVLPFNGVSRQTPGDSSVLDFATDQSVLDSSTSLDSVTDSNGIPTDSVTSNTVTSEMVTTSTEPKPTDPSITAFSTESIPTAPSTDASSTAGTTKQATTRNFDIRTFKGINMTTPNMAENVEISTQQNAKTTGVQDLSTSSPVITRNPTEPTERAAPPEILSRHVRQAISQPQAQPTATGPGMGPGSMYDPAQSAQNEAMMQQQYRSANTMSGTMLVTSDISAPSGPDGLKGNAGVAPSFPAASAEYAQQLAASGQSAQGMSSGPLQDPRMGPMTGDPTVDQSVPYEPPRIPPPPEVSAREIEAAIADSPIISSAVSDTGKPMDAGALLGTTYIAGLNEAASNLAETSTASRSGTMIVQADLTSPADRGKKTGGSVEYLSPTQGTSMSDKPSETQAQIPETKFSPSLGFMPTPEQIMSGMRGMSRPVPADTTNLEPTGPDPNVQNIQEAKEKLINQLGAAMGILPGSGQQPVPATPPAQAANLVPDQNIATVLAMAGLSGQTSAGPLASSAEAMANNQLRQNQMMDQSATMSMQSNAALQANEQALLSQTGDLPAAQGTKAIPGLMGRLTGQMGNMSPEVLQLLAQAQSSGIDPRMMLAGFSQGPAQLSIAPGTAIQGADGSLNIKMKANSGTQIQAQASSESGTIMAGGAGMIPPPSKMTGAVDKRIPFGQDAMIYEGTPNTKQGAVDKRIPYGQDAMIYEGASNTKQGAVDKRIPYGQDAMIYEGAPMAPGPNTPVGKDTMAQPTAEATDSSQQISSQTFAETAAQQNAIADKTANAANMGPNMMMDPTMLQNMMKMRLNPEMMKYIQFGAQGVHMIDQSGGMTGFENIFQQSQGKQQTAGNQQANVDAMTSATNQGAVSMVDMADMKKTAGLSKINQPQVEKSIITQEVISNPVQTQRLQEHAGMVTQGLAENQAMSQMQQGITGRQGMAQMQGGMSGQQGLTQGQEMAEMQLEMTGQQGMTQEQGMAQMQSSLTRQQGMTQEQLMAQLQSGMAGQTGQTVSSATNQQSDINMMNMGKLFGGKPGLIGGGIMAGTSKSDLSGVQYETANKMAVANQAGMAQQSSDPILQAEIGSAGQISTGVEASAADQSSATTNSLFGQGPAFSAGHNQLMGQFGFGSMNQEGDQSAVMSEVVSAPQNAITAQQVGPETSGTSGAFAGAVDASASAQSSMDVAAQTVSDVKSTADFTPVGSIGTFTSVSNVGPATPVTEQQWSWDPTSQTWVLVAASEVQASAQAQAADGVVSNQAQTQSAVDLATEGIVSTSQADGAQAMVNQQSMATDMSAMDQQVSGVSESQATQLSAGDQVMGQSGQTDLAGYQWNAGANAYIRVQSPDQAQAQANAVVNQVSDVQTGMTQGASGDIASAMQQYDGQTQAQMTAESLSQDGAASTTVSDQGTGQVGQTWEQAGYRWDAATNAYVPVGTLKQSVADSAQVGTTSEAVTAVDQASVQSGQSFGAGAIEMSASGSMQMSGSFDMSVGGAGDTPVAQQVPDQAQTTLYQQPNQLDSQAAMDAKTTLYQPPDQGITHQDARLDISGAQSADMSVTADITAGQQQGQTSATAQQLTQQASQLQANQAAQQGFQQQGAQPGFQQVDFTQLAQQQQQQQAGNLAVQGTMQESQQQSGSFSMQGSLQTDQIQGQDAGFQQKQDLRQSASAFDMTAQQSLSAEGRSKDFQQSPQQQTQSGTGPLMLETQPWEQQGANTQLNQQLQQIDVTSSAQVSQTSQQMGTTGIDQASQQQQWGQQAGQQVSQQADLSGMIQGSAQQQAVQDASQAAQNAQMQQWLAAQNVNTQASQTSAGPVQMTVGQWQQTGAATVGADAMGSAAAAMVSAQMQQQDGAAAMTAEANAAKQMQQVGSGAAQATDMQMWNQNMQTQTEVQGTQTVAQGSQTATVGTQTDTSFTPIGQTGSGADATATAWQAILAAAQAEAQKSMGIQAPAVTPIVTGQATAQQTAGQQFFAQQAANQQAAMQQAAMQQAAAQQAAMQQAAAQAAAQQATAQQAAAQKAAAQQQSTISWAEIINAAMAHQAETAKQQQAVQAQQQARPQVPAWATGMQTQQSSQTQQTSNTQVNQQQTVEAKPTLPQQPKAEPQRKIPIRPDPVTRDRVREMFISQMRQRPDIDPLQILIGLSPEMLMRSGVNPRIARSGEVAQIVPAVERALGISLRRRRGRGGRPRSDIGGAFADPMGGHTFSGPEPMSGRGQRGQSARDRAMQRRKFMMEQRMINEVMQLFGLGPEPLEPGDPGYRPPGQRPGRGGGAGPGMPGMGPDPMMGAGGAGMGGGAGGPAGNPQNRMMMELLGM